MAKGHKQTTTHSADAATNNMQNQVYGASQKAAKGYNTVGADPATMQAMGLFGNYANAGQQGMNALGGDQGAIDSMMNPYMKDVIGGVNDQYGQDSAMLRKNTNDAATQAGAFGGDRAALEQGAQQGALSLGHQQQIGGLLQGGYNDALARAAGLAQMGMQGAGAQFQGGDYLRNIAQQQANPDVMRQQILAQGMQGGNAGNYTNSQYTKTGAMQNILGGAATLGGLFGGIPGLGGMAAGMFGGGGAGDAYNVNDPQQNMFAGSNAMPFGAGAYRGGLFGGR